jgi:hypothetical protein
LLPDKFFIEQKGQFMLRKGILALTASLAMMQVVSATTYNASTAADIFTNVPKLVAGDSLILASGTYTFQDKETIVLSKSGERGNKIFFGTIGANRAVLDFSKHALLSTNQGVLVYGNYWYIRGIDITKAGDNGMLIEDTAVMNSKKWDDSHPRACYNIIEWCNFIENQDAGLQLKNGASFDTVINCDSYYNYDPTDGGDADGFAPKMNCGLGIYFYGCRAWQNSDDGWDHYLKDDGRAQASEAPNTTCEYSICYKNGYIKDGSEKGNGNGFKMGSEYLKVDFITRHCLSVGNLAKGFDANNNKGSMTMLNCSAYNNDLDYSMQSGSSVIKNCNSTGGASKIKVNSTVTTSDWTGTNTDFESVTLADLIAPRNTDGSLSAKTLAFMKPKSSDTKFINKGTDIGLPISGGKADIGWIEVGLDITSVKGMNISRSATSAGQLVTSIASVTNGVVKVDFTVLPSGKLDVAIFDIAGKKVMNISNTFGAANKSQIIDMSKLAAGSYVCNFSFSAFDGVKTDNLKLIKE